MSDIASASQRALLDGTPPLSMSATNLVPQKTWDYVEALCKRWDVPGLGISFVSIPKEGQGDVSVETKCFGVADTKGNPVTPDASNGGYADC